MKQVPIGIESFKELIDKNAYYVDKTQLIVDCIKEKCVLYTRPRRFGKTLNMSMLYYFFSNKENENAYLFDGLKVTEHPEVMKYQNQYPVIFMTLKDMKKMEYHKQLKRYRNLITMQAKKYTELLESPYLLEIEKKTYQQYINGQIDLDDLEPVLFNLTYLLHKHFKQKVIVLIDEYDVPLQAAYQNGYYEEMVDFLRDVFSSALKSNEYLEKGIMTGCLRISKESIFTGLNNFKVYSILEKRNEENFGFTENEVKQMLAYYHISECFDEVKEWYDGYMFGDKEIYNPWSTLMYVDDRIGGIEDSAQSYWSNTSGNDIVYNYIKKGGLQLRREFERMIDGKSVIKKIVPDLTYREMDNRNNVYSFLLMTGYLKVVRKINDEYELVIPNKEVNKIYEEKFIDYFNDYAEERKEDVYQAMIEGDAEKLNKILNSIFENRISYFDNKEDFYHGYLLGLLGEHDPLSNRESGDGRYDICLMPGESGDTAVIIECKHSSSEENLESDASKGLKQIIEKKYGRDIKDRSVKKVIGYGISFYKKKCYVVSENLLKSN